MRHSTLALQVLAVALAACAEPTGPTAGAPGAMDRTTSFWETGASVHASVYWNGVARDLVVKYRFNAFQAIRGYAALSVAQYNGIVAAEDTRTASGRQASTRAAVAGASAVVLAHLFPAETAALENLVAEQLASPVRPGEGQTDIAAGVVAGRAAAALIVGHTQADKSFTPCPTPVITLPLRYRPLPGPPGRGLGPEPRRGGA